MGWIKCGLVWNFLADARCCKWRLPSAAAAADSWEGPRRRAPAGGAASLYGPAALLDQPTALLQVRDTSPEF